MDDIKNMKTKNAEVMKIIGANIKSLRKERGIRQKEIADLFQIDQTAVSKWDQRGSNPFVVVYIPLSVRLPPFRSTFSVNFFRCLTGSAP